jgi:HSP20 family protein
MNKNEVTVQNESNVATSNEPEGGCCIVPNADIVETPDAFLLLVDLPGAVKEGISLKIERNELSIRASRQSSEPSDASYIHRELPSCGYARTFALGDGVDAGNVDAQFDLGVLTVKLFKSEQMKPREITIN